MNYEYLLILFCSIFSLFCSLIKQLYDAHYYPRNLYSFVIDVILSAVSGIIVTLILSEYVESELTLIGLSGLGGMVGLSGIKAIIKIRLGQKIQIQFVDDNDTDIKVDDIIKSPKNK